MRRSARFRPRASTLLALALYAALALLIFGRGVIASPADHVIGLGGADTAFNVWALGWWPHAIAAGHDPFAARVVWAPDGESLAWATGIPGAALLALPVTLLAGLVPAYDLLALAAPVSAALAAFLLARWCSGRADAALLAGLGFGFGPYVSGQTLGHLNLMLVAAVPLLALVVLRRHADELGRGSFVVAAAALLVLEFLISNEVFATLALVTATAVAAAWWRGGPTERRRLRRTIADGAIAYGAGLALLSPYLGYALVVDGAPPRALAEPRYWATDLANLVVPTSLTWLQPPGSAGIAVHFTGNVSEQGAYLGAPVLLLLVVAALARRRRYGQTVALLVLGFGIVAELGLRVRLDGHQIARSPLGILAKLPLTNNVLPMRLSLYVLLLAMTILAVWAADPGRRRPLRLAAFALAVACLLPTPHGWTARVPDARFFASGAWLGVVRPDANLLVVPFGDAGWSEYWQARAGYRFRLTGGYVKAFPPPSFARYPIVAAFHAGVDQAGARESLRPLLRDKRVDAVVLVPGTAPPIAALVRGVLGPGRRIADAEVWVIGR